jgi:hypothetical protein
MIESYADEGWLTNYWHRTHFLADVRSSRSMEWYFRLLRDMPLSFPDVKKYKSSFAVKMLRLMDKNSQTDVWKSLQDVMIVIFEPKEILKKFGVSIGAGDSYIVTYKDVQYQIRKADQEMYEYYDGLIKDLVCDAALGSSPITTLGYSLSQLIVAPRTADFFTPENILSMIGKTEGRKKVIGAIKLASRLFVAFFEVTDPATQKRVASEIVERGLTLGASPVHAALLRETLSVDRYFDRGDALSINIIKSCVEEIGSSLKYFYEEETLPRPIIGESSFDESPFIQAADWAVGIARDVYEKSGIEGVKQKFKYVIYNGEMMFG